MGIVFDKKDEPWKGLIRTTELRPIGHIDIVGQCASGYRDMLVASADEYNLKFPTYIHWVIENPRGAGTYGYYLVREKRL